MLDPRGNSMECQHGFSLIELVSVIVILAVLAVTVLPRFVDLKTGAENALFRTTMGSFISGLTILRAELAAENRFGQSAVPVGEQILDVNSDGYPTNFSANGCVTFWKDVHTTSDPVEPWLTTPAGITANTWEALTLTGTPGGCIYATRRTGIITRLLIYFPDPTVFGFTENVFVFP